MGEWVGCGGGGAGDGEGERGWEGGGGGGERGWGVGGVGKGKWKSCLRDDHNLTSRRSFETLTNAFYSIFQKRIMSPDFGLLK